MHILVVVRMSMGIRVLLLLLVAVRVRIIVSVVVSMAIALRAASMVVSMAVSILMLMLMPMPMTVAVVMSMTMVMVTECCHSNEVHQQPEGANHKELAESLRLPPLDYPLKCFKHDFDADEDQKDTIGKATERLDLAKTIWKPLARGPLASHCRKKTNGQRYAVEKHVYTVAEEAE